MSFPIYSPADPNVFTDAPRVITVPANTATIIFFNEQQSGKEITQRLFQNVGNNPCFYSENLLDSGLIQNNPNPTAICDGTLLYHGIVSAGQQLDCSSHKQAVCVFSVAGTTISTTVRRRYNN